MKIDRGADGVVEITISRPPVNAFDITLLNELADALEHVAPDDRVVIIRAEGSGFCAGGNVKEVEALPGFAGILGQAEGSLRAVLAILNCAVPVIIAVHGHCIGVGVLLAGAADILIASDDSRLVLAEIDNGATAGGVLALRLLPEKRARAAMMTTEPINAAELHAYGAVHQIVPNDKLAYTARDTARRIAAKPAAAMRRLKRSLFNSSRTAELEAAYRAELSYTYELNMIGEAGAGRDAFLSGKRAGYLPEIDDRPVDQ